MLRKVVAVRFAWRLRQPFSRAVTTVQAQAIRSNKFDINVRYQEREFRGSFLARENGTRET